MAVVALVVIGGATRVMEAGLACPDWPLCYGTLLPGKQMNAQVFLEWFHRLGRFHRGHGSAGSGHRFRRMETAPSSMDALVEPGSAGHGGSAGRLGCSHRAPAASVRNCHGSFGLGTHPGCSPEWLNPATPAICLAYRLRFGGVACRCWPWLR